MIYLFLTTYHSRTVYLLGSRRISSELLKAIYYRIHLFAYPVSFFLYFYKSTKWVCVFFYTSHIGTLIYFEHDRRAIVEILKERVECEWHRSEKRLFDCGYMYQDNLWKDINSYFRTNCVQARSEVHSRNELRFAYCKLCEMHVASRTLCSQISSRVTVFNFFEDEMILYNFTHGGCVIRSSLANEEAHSFLQADSFDCFFLARPR